jgi:hypothetical protein
MRVANGPPFTRDCSLAAARRLRVIRRPNLAILLALLVAIADVPPAAAQVGEEIPSANYYVAVHAVYTGEYREAVQDLRRQSQRGLRTTLARWVDSICYHAMLGEVFYHQGRNAEALAEFDQACQYVLQYPNWLTRVNFQRPPQPDPNLARRAAPWGQSTRQSTPAQFPRTEQVAFGDFVTSDTLRRGGVISMPEYRRVNVVEIVRTSALAIRRRAELLGPLAPHDQLFKDLASALARGNLSPPGHWSSVWIDLQRGLVQSALGQFDQAGITLNRAMIAAGQFDHPLTCVALLEQARLAIRTGNGVAASQLLAEAGFSAYYYENWDVLTESVWLGWANYVAHGGAGVYQAVDAIGTWAQANRLQHITVKLRLAQAESLLWAGQLPQAATLLGGPARPLGQMAGSLATIHHLYLQAVLNYLQGKPEPGGEALTQALTAQAAASLRNFQIGLTDKSYDAGAISPRVAADLYKALLAEPTAADWAYQPVDVMAVLTTAHDASFDRWFLAALERKDFPSAFDVTEQAKRRRFLASLPLGGRLVALRAILEAPERELSRDAVLQRQQFIASFPAYRELSAAGTVLQNELRAGSVLAKPGDAVKPLSDRYELWRQNAESREQMLMQFALRRLPSSLEFPPSRPLTDLQKLLAEGEALVVFHAAAGQLYGFVITTADTHQWKVSDARRLRARLIDFLRDLGNYSGARTLSAEELTKTAWHKSSSEAYNMIFAESRLDLSKTKTLVIVPDDLLWYLPFEVLSPDATAPPQVLAARVPIRYGPTAALVVGNDLPLRRPRHSGIVAAELNADEAITGGEDLIGRLEKQVTGPLRIEPPLAVPGYLVAPLLDSLIVLDDVSIDRAAVNAWSPLPRSPAGANDSLDAWSRLPFGGPERLVVTSFTTEAEQGLRGSRRGAAGPPGSEVFQTTCALMASGTRTILLSRWRTGGRTNFDMVSEFVQELPQATAADAWRRAIVLAREAPVDIAREPRLKRSDELTSLPSADHPFFWAGYLLVDTGTRPDTEDPWPTATGIGGEVTSDAAGTTIRTPAAPLPAPQSRGEKQSPAESKTDPVEKKSDK